MRRDIPIPLLTSKYLTRLLKKVIFSEDSDCWLWGGVTTKYGYGQVTIGKQRYKAHRVMYAVCVGPIPTGSQPDHTCHNKNQCSGGNACPHRRCINPDHLEPVTQLINTRRGVRAESRKTSCPKGHPYDRVDGSGTRRCMQCRNENRRVAYDRNRDRLLLEKRRHYEANREQINAHRRQLRVRKSIGSAWQK